MNRNKYLLCFITIVLVLLLSGCGSAKAHNVTLTLQYRLTKYYCSSGGEIYTNTKPVISADGGILTVELKNYYQEADNAHNRNYFQPMEVDGPYVGETLVVVPGGGGGLLGSDSCSLSVYTNKNNFQVELVGP
jgi:hypothetical protein